MLVNENAILLIAIVKRIVEGYGVGMSERSGKSRIWNVRMSNVSWKVIYLLPEMTQIEKKQTETTISKVEQCWGGWGGKCLGAGL